LQDGLRYILMQQSGVFRAGTSGLVLAEPNKKSYPAEFQDKSRLCYYASQFNSIEINSSFYKIPRGRTYKNWAEMVPDHFQFTVKLWKGITHERNFSVTEKELEIFMSAIDCLGEKRGCLLIQFPAKTEMPVSAFVQLLDAIRKLDPEETWRIAVEFRHVRWYDKTISGILNEYRAGLVLHDMPASATYTLNEKAPFVYLRFHGEKGDYRGSYSEPFLKEKAEDIRAWLKRGKDVYAYFNNTIGDAVANVKTLNRLIKETD
jgi:uncharacterized protein YecE (DUF72 family)